MGFKTERRRGPGAAVSASADTLGGGRRRESCSKRSGQTSKRARSHLREGEARDDVHALQLLRKRKGRRGGAVSNASRGARGCDHIVPLNSPSLTLNSPSLTLNSPSPTISCESRTQRARHVIRRSVEAVEQLAGVGQAQLGDRLACGADNRGG
eukprot:1042082-Pyramimonas_sp.AAC.1